MDVNANNTCNQYCLKVVLCCLIYRAIKWTDDE